MIIAIASGKGGTGKTTVATNLALSVDEGNVWLLDCDVEEPNCHIFLNPKIEHTKKVRVFTPVVDEEKCTACGECGKICQYSAIVSLKTKPLVFPALCHGCRGCMLVCPEGAISEGYREIGVVEEGRVEKIDFVHGKLKIGEVMSPSLIRAVKKSVHGDGLIIIDSPPGTSCPVIEGVKESDYVVLVTEPTPFGLNDLRLAVDMVRELEIPFGVVINRADIGDKTVLDYCRSEEIPVLLEIPNDRRVAEAYSRGELMIHAVPEYKQHFENLLKTIAVEAKA